MKFQRLLLLLCCSIVASQALSQANALITGHIQEDLVGTIGIEIDRTWLDNSVDEHTSTVQNGKFGFAFHVDFPQLVTLHYARNSVQLYIEPNDSLHIEFEASTFKYSMNFKGKSANNNVCYKAYVEKFGSASDEFSMKYLRKNIYYYRLPEASDALMQQLGPDAYMEKLAETRRQKQAFLEGYILDGLDLSDGFVTYLQADITYERAFNLLAYGHLYGGRHSLAPDFLDFLEQVRLLEPQALGNENYRRYLDAYMNYLYEYIDMDSDPYIGQYQLADERLDGLVRYYFQSGIIVRAFKKDLFELILPTYDKFIKQNPYAELDTRVVDAYQGARRFAPGSKAPNFSLKDPSGKTVSLSQYSGKVVYLDFWATWCRPCITKLNNMQDLEARLSAEGVVFIHISLDQTRDGWLEHLSQNAYRGVQLMANQAMEDPVVKAYDIRSLPKFFMINRQGNFVNTPPTSNLESIESALQALLQEP